MTEEAGRDIGGKLGRVIEVDKRSWQADQAKFMRVRVDLPIEKPLRRGRFVTNMDGERCWVSFKYERLPTFCFTCGKIGHDDKHCGIEIEKQPLERQYGEWMRAGGASKGTTEGSKGAGSSSNQQRSGDVSGEMAQSMVGKMVVSSQDDKGKSCSRGGQNSLEEREKFEKGRHDVKSDVCAASYQSRWDNKEAEKHEFSKGLGPGSPLKPNKEVTRGELVKEVVNTNENSFPLMGRSLKPNNEGQEAIISSQSKLNKDKEECGAVFIGPSKKKKGPGKVNIKKSAREIGKAQSSSMNTQVISVGNKRREDTEELAASEGRLSKKSYDGQGKKATFFCDEMAVAARQHRREQ